MFKVSESSTFAAHILKTWPAHFRRLLQMTSSCFFFLRVSCRTSSIATLSSIFIDSFLTHQWFADYSLLAYPSRCCRCLYRNVCCYRHASGRARDATAHHQTAAELSAWLAERGTGIASAIRHSVEARETSANTVHTESLAARVRLKDTHYTSLHAALHL